MNSGLVPAYTLRQENADLKKELQLHAAGLVKYAEKSGVAQVLMAMDYSQAIKLRVEVHGESIAEAIETIWCNVCTPQHREHYMEEAELFQTFYRSWIE